MAKSILELFKTTPTSQIKTLDGNNIPYSGKTSEEKYDVRNSKNIVLSSNSPLMQPFFWAINKLRTNETLTARTKEHFIEEEAIGLRPLRAISTTVLYGTNLLRLTTQTTPTVAAMKQSSRGGEASGGLIGKLLTKVSKGSVNSLEQLETTINSKLGIPQSLYPTSYASRFENDPVFDRMITIGEIKNDGKGTVLGKFLKDSGGGTPQQLAKQILGNSISLGKSAIRSRLFGTPVKPGTNDKLGFAYNRPSDGERMFITRFYADGEFTYTNRYKQEVFVSSTGAETNSRLGNGSVIGDRGKIIDMDSLKPPNLQRNRMRDTSINNGLPTYVSSVAYRTTVNGSLRETLEAKRGLRNNSDAINQTGVISVDEASKNLTDRLQDMDLIPLRFQSMAKNNLIYMRAVVSGLSEKYTPTWDSSRMVGSPFNFYNYSSVERGVSFTLKAYAMSQAELIIMWQKLNYLAQFAYPANYSEEGVPQPNLLYLTLGNLYVNKPAIINSLTYTVPDAESLWEIGGSEAKVRSGEFNRSPDWATPLKKDTLSNPIQLGNWRNVIKNNSTDITDNIESELNKVNVEYITEKSSTSRIDMNDYKLPKFIDISIDITFLESRQQTSKNLYGMGTPINFGVSPNTGNKKYNPSENKLQTVKTSTPETPIPLLKPDFSKLPTRFGKL